jgi:hypothetical protein
VNEDGIVSFNNGKPNPGGSFDDIPCKILPTHENLTYIIPFLALPPYVVLQTS